MITYKIPHKARFFPVSFSAKFTLNSPIANGTYQGSTQQKILTIQKNSVYLLERMSLSANIPEDVFQQSLIITDYPVLFFMKKQESEPLYKYPFRIINYQHERDISTFLTTNRDNEDIICSISGILNQVPDTVGLFKIDINVQLNWFVMDMNSYNKFFREELENNYGEDIRK